MSVEEKKMLQRPRRDVLTIRMCEKGIGHTQLKRSLKRKWKLIGDFSLIDVGHDDYVTRFTNDDDYDHVLTKAVE